MLYNKFLIVNCEWGQWRFGACSKECGGGKRIDTREQEIEAAHGGEECTGLSAIEEDCNIQECPGIQLMKILIGIEFFYIQISTSLR